MGDSLTRETVRAIGGKATPDAIELRNIDRGMVAVKWDAIYGGNIYKCSADDMLKRVFCAQR